MTDEDKIDEVDRVLAGEHPQLCMCETCYNEMWDDDDDWEEEDEYEIQTDVS